MQPGVVIRPATETDDLAALYAAAFPQEDLVPLVRALAGPRGCAIRARHRTLQLGAEHGKIDQHGDPLEVITLGRQLPQPAQGGVATTS